MEVFAYVICAVWSSIVDIRTRTVPNFSVLFFAVLFLCFENHEWKVALAAAFLLIGIRTLSFQGLGFGDIKLSIALSLHCHSVNELINSLIFSFVAAGVWIILIGLIKRSIPSSLAMAPFLWLGFLTSL